MAGMKWSVLAARGLARGAGALALGLWSAAAAAQASPKVAAIPPDAQIIFSSDRGGTRDKAGIPVKELYVATLAGPPVQITHAGLSHNHFTVSPDRRYIAANRFARGDADGDGEYLAVRDAKELWLIDTVAGTERPLAEDYDAGWGGIAFGPDGQHIYFSSYDPAALKGRGSYDAYLAGSFDIYRVAIATGVVETMTQGLNALLGIDDPRKFVSDVDVSPDGQWMAFVYKPSDMVGKAAKNRIGIMRIDGGQARIIDDGGPLPPQRIGQWSAGNFDPDFSPDGTRVAFARSTTVRLVTPMLGTMDILHVGIDGTGLTQVSPLGNPNTHGIPSWGPDGIIVSEYRAADDIGPAILDPAGGAEPRRIDTSGIARHVQWIPKAP